MIRFFFTWIGFFTSTIAFNSSYGQVKNEQAKESLTPLKPITNGQPKVIKNHFIDKYPPTSWIVQCGLQDKAGNLWFGTNADGVYYYDGKTFTNFTRNDGLCHNDVLCILEDTNGDIWFGTRGGLCRYKPSIDKNGAKDFACFSISENISSNLDKANSVYGGGFINNFVWSMMQDKSGKIWFGTNEGVYLYNPLIDTNNDTPLFKPFLGSASITNKYNLHLKMIQRIVEDKNGNIWFASGNFDGEGICFYDGKSIINFKPEGIKSFRSILQIKNGDLLFLTNNILNNNQSVYQFDGKIFTNFTNKIGLKNELITTVLEDKAGNLWFGTDNNNFEKEGNGGIWHYNGSSLRLFTTKDGLSNNSVFCIVEDRNRNIWFGTKNTGLGRYDGKTFTDYTE